MEYIFNDAGAKLAIVSNQFQLNEVQKVRENVPTLEKVILMAEKEGASEPGAIGFSRVYDTNETQALQGIATILTDRYRTYARIKPVIDVVQQIYKDNFFPQTRATWATYPAHIGHMIWTGCFRCHDGRHASTDGQRSIKASDCNSCHTILAQGRGEELNTLAPNGQKFKHPGDELDENPTCNECHTGGL